MADINPVVYPRSVLLYDCQDLEIAGFFEDVLPLLC